MKKNYYFDDDVSIDSRIRTAMSKMYQMSENGEREVYNKAFTDFLGKLMFFGEKVSTFVVGPKSSGKNYLVEQAANLLGMDAKIIRCDEEENFDELLIDLYEPYVKGQIVVIDKADLMNPEEFKVVASLPEYENAIIDGIAVKKHPDFRLVFTCYDRDSSEVAIEENTTVEQRNITLDRAKTIFDWANDHCNVIHVNHDPIIDAMVTDKGEKLKIMKDVKK